LKLYRLKDIMNYNTNEVVDYRLPSYVDNWIDYPPYQYLVLKINREDFSFDDLPIEPFSFRYLTSRNGGIWEIAYLIETVSQNVLNWFYEVIESFITHLKSKGFDLSYFIEDYTYFKEIGHWEIYSAVNRNFLEFKFKTKKRKIEDLHVKNINLDDCIVHTDKDVLFHSSRLYFYKFLSFRPNYILTYNFVFQKVLNFKRQLGFEFENNDLKNLVGYLFQFLEEYENVNSTKELKNEYNKKYYEKNKGDVMSPQERNLIINLKRKENTKKRVQGTYSLSYIKKEGGLKLNGKPNYKKIGEIWGVDHRTAKRLFDELS